MYYNIINKYKICPWSYLLKIKSQSNTSLSMEYLNLSTMPEKHTHSTCL